MLSLKHVLLAGLALGILWNMLLFILSAFAKENTYMDWFVDLLFYPTGTLSYQIFQYTCANYNISTHNFVVFATISFVVSAFLGSLLAILLYLPWWLSHLCKRKL